MRFYLKSVYVCSISLALVHQAHAMDGDLQQLKREWNAQACSALVYGQRNPLEITETPNVSLAVRYGQALMRAGRGTEAYAVLYGALRKAIPFGVPHALQNAFAEYRRTFGYPTQDQGIIFNTHDIPEAHPTRTDGYWLAQSDGISFLSSDSDAPIYRLNNTADADGDETRAYSTSGDTAVGMSDSSGLVVAADFKGPRFTIPTDYWQSFLGRVLLGNGQGIVRFDFETGFTVRPRVISRKGTDVTQELHPDLVDLRFQRMRQIFSSDHSVVGLLVDRSHRVQARSTWDFSRIFEWTLPDDIHDRSLSLPLHLFPAARGQFYLAIARISTTADDPYKIWLLNSQGQEIQKYSVHDPDYSCAYDVSPTGEHFAIGNQAAGFKVIDKAGKTIGTIPGLAVPSIRGKSFHSYSAISFSADGSKLVVRSFYFNQTDRHQAVRIFSLDGTHLATPFERRGSENSDGHSPSVILHSPDGTYFVGTNAGTKEVPRIWYWAYDGTLLMTQEGGTPLFLNTGNRAFILSRDGDLRAIGMAQ